jgi:hypothetical protein
MSRSLPIRPSGIKLNILWRTGSGMFSVMAVAMNPGAIALTVMLRLATSEATALVRPMMPAFEAM